MVWCAMYDCAAHLRVSRQHHRPRTKHVEIGGHCWARTCAKVVVLQVAPFGGGGCVQSCSKPSSSMLVQRPCLAMQQYVVWNPPMSSRVPMPRTTIYAT